MSELTFAQAASRENSSDSFQDQSISPAENRQVSELKYHLGEFVSRYKTSQDKLERVQAAIGALSLQFLSTVQALNYSEYRQLGGELTFARKGSEQDFKRLVFERGKSFSPNLSEVLTKLGRIYDFVQALHRLNPNYPHSQDSLRGSTVTDAITVMRLARKGGINMKNPEEEKSAVEIERLGRIKLSQGGFSQNLFKPDFSLEFNWLSSENAVLISEEGNPDNQAVIQPGQEIIIGRPLVQESLFGLTPDSGPFTVSHPQLVIPDSRASRIGVHVEFNQNGLVISNKLIRNNAYNIKSDPAVSPDNHLHISFMGDHFPDGANYTYGQSIIWQNNI